MDISVCALLTDSDTKWPLLMTTACRQMVFIELGDGQLTNVDLIAVLLLWKTLAWQTEGRRFWTCRQFMPGSTDINRRLMSQSSILGVAAYPRMSLESVTGISE